MIHRIAVSATAGLLLVGVVLAQGPKSGPQVGEEIPGAFNPLNVNGPSAGEKRCQVWLNGPNPVAMIFARQISDPLTSLVKKLDEATGKNIDARMGSFAVFCSDDEKLEKQLRDLAVKEKLKHFILTIENAAGPLDYKVARDAEVTVVLYTNYLVKANYSFKKGELDAKAVDKIVADLPKILPEKK